jgi:hypothetical protein
MQAVGAPTNVGSTAVGAPTSIAKPRGMTRNLERHAGCYGERSTGAMTRPPEGGSNMNTKMLSRSVLLLSLLTTACAPMPEGESPDAVEAALSTPKPDAEPVLGAGWDAVKQTWRSTCLVGPQVPVGGGHADLTLTLEQNQQKLLDRLGFSASGRAQYGVVSGSAQADLAQTLSENEVSETLVFKQNIETPGLRFQDDYLARPQLTPEAKEALRNGPEAFRKVCGDDVLVQEDRGASLLIVYRLSFTSKQAKQEFKASAKIAGGLGSVETAIQENKEKFASKLKLSLKAVQFGGEPKNLAYVISPKDTGSCSVDDLDACRRVVKGALDYAAGTNPTGFPHQVDVAHTNAIGYMTRSWDSLGYPLPRPEVPQALKDARESLDLLFQDLMQAGKMIDSVANGPLQDAAGARLGDWQKKYAHDLRLFTDEPTLQQRCYDNIDLSDASIKACVAVSGTVLTVPVGEIAGFISNPPPALVVIRSQMNRKLIDADAANLADGRPIHMWHSDGGDVQKWRFYADGTIRVQSTGKCMDVLGSAQSEGAPIGTWTCHGGSNQQWDYDANQKTIKSRWSNLCLDISRGDGNDGAAIIQYRCHAENNQRWDLVPIQ